MTVEKVFVANNGEVFFKHNTALVVGELTKEEENGLKLQAKEMLEDGNFENAVIEVHGDNIFVDYYDESGDFIGHGGVHITDNFNTFQDYMYLIRKTDDNTLERVLQTSNTRHVTSL